MLTETITVFFSMPSGRHQLTADARLINDLRDIIQNYNDILYSKMDESGNPLTPERAIAVLKEHA